MTDADMKVVHIEYREFIQYPDAKLTDLFEKYGLDPDRPHDIVYNQSLRRYEISQTVKENRIGGDA